MVTIATTEDIVRWCRLETVSDSLSVHRMCLKNVQGLGGWTVPVEKKHSESSDCKDYLPNSSTLDRVCTKLSSELKRKKEYI